MPLPSSGPIDLNSIQTEFGGTNPIGLNEYYRGGAYTTANNTNVPTSGTISLNQFYGATKQSPLNIEVLMMAGGGGTLSRYGARHPGTGDDNFITAGGGGGGAGGLYIYSATLNPGTSRTVTIGGGGNGAANGSNTSFTGASNAIGGGYGSAANNATLAFTGISGGSGGGGASGGTGGPATSGQGNSGGGSSFVSRGPWGSGGGGGKGGAGGAGPGPIGGVGGSGYDLATFRGGSSLTVAFGGGGAGENASQVSIIGNNGDGTTTRSPAANTGGGSRNANSYNSTGTGGSGRVIVRYTGSTAKATGGTITTATVSGTPYTIHDFTAGGTFTVN
jgi:hypothetical protein